MFILNHSKRKVILCFGLSYVASYTQLFFANQTSFFVISILSSFQPSTIHYKKCAWWAHPHKHQHSDQVVHPGEQHIWFTFSKMYWEARAQNLLFSLKQWNKKKGYACLHNFQRGSPKQLICLGNRHNRKLLVWYEGWFSYS